MIDRYKKARFRPGRYNPCFLLVSSDDDIISVVKERLSRNKCEVLALNDLQAIDRAFKNRRIDIALLDMSFRIPEHNAFDLYRLIRSLNRATKICFLTSFSMSRKEFLRVFPSTQLDFVINKKEMTPGNLYELYRAALNQTGSATVT